ncbi:MAG: hypothetical protein KAI66_09200 [Lentisphaeria bacterium]|nr:hypothetical protein [Lentisphaeria bacterium]
MKRAIALLALAMLQTFCPAADKPAVKILAYIHQTSGCQTHTEAFLAELAKKHAGKVTLEIVDFGTKKGRKRQLAAGHKCMAITLNGTIQAKIVTQGVTLDVAFRMPAGYFWKHEELEIALRQLLSGVTKSDRASLKISALAGDKGTRTLVVGGKEIITLADAKRIDAAVATLRKLMEAKPIVQDQFRIAGGETEAVLTIRETPFLTLTKADAEDGKPTFEDLVLNTARTFGDCFPRVQRPYPGMRRPGGRR